MYRLTRGQRFPTTPLKLKSKFQPLFRNLFPKSRGLVITLMNGLFGSSSGVYLVFKLLYQNGIPLSTLFIAYTILSLFCFVRTILLMSRGLS